MSGGNANTTISGPGPNWTMLWGNGPFGNFQLDIVGLLAVLGEGSVLANAQVSALSTLIYLPRLIPAPQALLHFSRPEQLEPVTAKVAGVESGMLKPYVHHVAHVLLGDNMDKWTVRCVKVTKSDQKHIQSWADRLFRGEKRQDYDGPVIKAKANGPMTYVTLLSFSLSVTLFIASIVWGDGMSLLATILLSFLSTLIGVINKWSLSLSQRPKGAGLAPKGDVVIRYPNGSFLVVRCDEEVARELYFAPEEIDYSVTKASTYRLISLVGTLMLMGGVISLANAKLQLQIAWAGAYIITNAAHFIAAAAPPRMHWDLSCYTLKEESVEKGPEGANFTDALWKAIVFTKKTGWIKKAEAAPSTKVWDKWLEEAEHAANEVGYEFGSLIDPNPIWECDDKETGVIWNVPANWDAKREWERINGEFRTESQSTTSTT